MSQWTVFLISKSPLPASYSCRFIISLLSKSFDKSFIACKAIDREYFVDFSDVINRAAVNFNATKACAGLDFRDIQPITAVTGPYNLVRSVKIYDNDPERPEAFAQATPSRRIFKIRYSP